MAEDNQIEAALFAARDALSTLQRESITLANRLADPDDQEWLEIDRRIEESRAKIRRLEALKAAGNVYKDEEVKAELQAKRKAAFNQATQVARERVKLAEKIDKSIAALGELLKQWDETGEECHRNAAYVHASDDQPGWTYSLMSAARGNNNRFSSALEWQLFLAGVGRTGIPFDSTIIRRQIGDPHTMRDAAVHTATQIDAQLTRSLEHLKVA